MVDVRVAQRPALPAFILGSYLFLSVPASVCEAAVVRSLHSSSDAAVTEVVVECDATAPVHGRSESRRDGLLFVVEIDGASLGERTTRVLPVEDPRVRGVVVVGDGTSGSVRLLFDLARKVETSVQTLENPARLRVRFTDVVGGAGSDKRRSDVSARETAAARPVVVARSTGAAPGGRTSGGAGPPSMPPLPALAEQQRRAAKASPPSRGAVTSRRLIVLDPGHGGKDPGAPAQHGEWEKDIVLDLSRRVAERLRRRLGVEVLMTRSEDVFVSLPERRALATRWGAELFVSIHANASVNAAASGIETYYHSGSPSESRRAADRATRRLVREENGRHAGAHGAGVRAASVSSAALPSLLQVDSKRLARNIQGELVRNLGMRYDAVRDLGVKDGRFFVLEDIDVPSVLVEAAFLTHREEGLRIHSSVYREQVAEGIFKGIQRYLAGQARPGAL